MIVKIVWKKTLILNNFYNLQNQKSYWFKRNEPDYNNLEDPNDVNQSDLFEREPTDLYASVKIRNLTKVFININHQKKY